MLSELAGFTVTRALPDNVLMGIISGANTVYGGVIRNNTGQIVAHLANAANPISLVSPLNLINPIMSSINTVQLARLGANVNQLLSLAKGTMALSGLTLGVSAVGFIFLNNKLKKVDNSLKEIEKGVQEIKEFLALSERSELFTALEGLEIKGDKQARESICERTLVDAKKTLSNIHKKYHEMLDTTNVIEQAIAVEEYYTITAIGRARADAELGRFNQAHTNLVESYNNWKRAAQRISKELILKNNPKEFMHPRYLSNIRTDELIDWLDFANDTNNGTDWIDALRGEFSKMGFNDSLKDTCFNLSFILKKKFSKKTNLKKEEEIKIGLMQKIVARNRVFEGYVNQYQYFAETNQSPSSVQTFIESIPKETSVEDCFILLSNDYRQAA